MDIVIRILRFFNDNEGSFSLLTSVITIVVTIYIARMPYKKKIDIAVKLRNSNEYSRLYDEFLLETKISKEEYYNHYFVADANIVNVGINTLLIKKIEFVERGLINKKKIGSYEGDLLKQEFVLPMKKIDKLFPIESKVDLNEIDGLKLMVIVCFQGSKRKYRYRNCVINEL